MRKYWIAVVGPNQSEPSYLEQGWWCIQKSALAGDLLLGYRTTTADHKNNGIFAISRILQAPDPHHENANLCRDYGKQAGEVFYTPVQFIKRFPRRLNIQEMKRDPVLAKLDCVHRNFQGTNFELRADDFNLIMERIGETDKF